MAMLRQDDYQSMDGGSKSKAEMLKGILRKARLMSKCSASNTEWKYKCGICPLTLSLSSPQ